VSMLLFRSSRKLSKTERKTAYLDRFSKKNRGGSGLQEGGGKKRYRRY